MEPVREEVCRRLFGSSADPVALVLAREDFSPVYPGLERYCLSVTQNDRTLALFYTNSFEYSPMNPLTAKTAAQEKARAWAEELAEDPAAFVRATGREEPSRPAPRHADLVLFQGSPRPDGNCGILALWAAGAAEAAGKTVRVIYPHDLDIHCCIGCYQCYNTGTCVFGDDMREIIDDIREASLVIVCSPVYTNTVTGGIKLVIDRMQAYHAERVLRGGRFGQRGLVFSVAGRTGGENFTCITKVVTAFFRNLGIVPSGQILIDRVDAVRDIRTLPGLEERVKDLVRASLPE